jgi:hypothetical protein
MRPPSAVLGLIIGQDRPQMPRTEDQHPVGDLSPVGPEYTIVVVTCSFSQQGGAVRRRSGIRA